jgi:hypothetical protein
MQFEQPGVVVVMFVSMFRRRIREGEGQPRDANLNEPVAQCQYRLATVEARAGNVQPDRGEASGRGRSGGPGTHGSPRRTRADPGRFPVN